MKVYRSNEPDVHIPQLDLLTLLFGANFAEDHHDRVHSLITLTESSHCLAKEDTKIHVDAAVPEVYVTKASARDLVKRTAYTLRNRFGIGKNCAGSDVVLTVCNGCVYLPNFFYAVLAAGGIFSSASTSFTPIEIARQIKDSKARLLVCTPDCEKATVDAARLCGMSMDSVMVLGMSSSGDFSLVSAKGQRNMLEPVSGQRLEWERVKDESILKSRTVALLYSSGTTGLPKGVRIAHRGLVASLIVTMHVARKFRQRSSKFRFDTIAHLPMGIAGIDMYCTNPFYMGGTTYWMPKYDFNTFIEHHRRYRPAFQFTVPPVWLRIAKSSKVTDHFDGLEVATTGSAPLGYETAQQVRRKLGRGEALFTQTYGTTETSGSICAQDYHIHDDTWSVGYLCPNTTARVLDENDQDVEPGQSGELLIGGPILSQGYHDRPDADKESFLCDWYRTGDIAVLREDRVYIVDRKKELIKYKAQQIAPAELEALLISHDDIADAAVIGVWNESQQTEVPRAYVVPVRSSLTREDVQRFVADNLAPYKQLRGGVVFTNDIPKSASGKILRKELRNAAKGEIRSKL